MNLSHALSMLMLFVLTTVSRMAAVKCQVEHASFAKVHVLPERTEHNIKMTLVLQLKLSPKGMSFFELLTWW